MSAAGRPEPLEGLWARFWAECLRSGVHPSREADMRDAFTAGVLAGLLRAKQIGRDPAWREAMKSIHAVHVADMAEHDAGLRRLEGGPDPPRGWSAY